MDFEDEANCLVKFKSGTTGLINVGWYSQDYTLRVDFYGSVKHVSARHHPPNFLYTATQMLALGTSKYFWPHFTELQHFVTCLARDKIPSPSGQDGLEDLKAIDRAYKNTMNL
jgi:predicted dehydrogenase